jgi:ribosome modulation factor
MGYSVTQTIPANRSGRKVEAAYQLGYRAGLTGNGDMPFPLHGAQHRAWTLGHAEGSRVQQAYRDGYADARYWAIDSLPFKGMNWEVIDAYDLGWVEASFPTDFPFSRPAIQEGRIL